MAWEVVEKHAVRDILVNIPTEIFQNERWFSEKSSRGTLELADTVLVKQSAGDEMLALNLFRWTTGPVKRFYFIPFFISGNPQAGSPWLKLDGYYCYDGIPTLEYVTFILQSLWAERSFPTGSGMFDFHPVVPFPRLQLSTHGSSSNSLLFVTGGMLVKNYRLVFAGPHPELETGIALAEHGSRSVPEIYGYLQYHSGSDDYTLMLLEERIESEGTAWEVWKEPMVNPAASRDLMAEADSLGETIARLHLELEQMSRRIGQFGPFEAAMLSEKISGLERIIHDQLLPQLKDMAEMALDQLHDIRQTIHHMNWGFRFRIHGDLHLEQVLKTDSGWKVIDFEGEPLKSIGERGNWDSPLKDLASLLRSVSYRVYSLNPVAAKHYEDALQRQIVAGYLKAYHGFNGEFLPDIAAIHELLDIFQLERVIYEYMYELKYRPDWVRIPEAGLKRLLQRNRRKS